MARLQEAKVDHKKLQEAKVDHKGKLRRTQGVTPSPCKTNSHSFKGAADTC